MALPGAAAAAVTPAFGGCRANPYGLDGALPFRVLATTAPPRILKRPTALLGDCLALPDKSDIDAPLLIGAVLFGVGWGLSGYCQGPALVSLVTLSPAALVFVSAMGIGLILGGVALARLNGPRG